MRRLPPALLLAAAACIHQRSDVAPSRPNAEPGEVLRAAELARIRCLLIAPFDNTSNAPSASDAATGALLSSVDPSRTRVFPVPELRAMFRDTAVELPQGIAPSLALELAELLGADAALYGSVEGRTQEGSTELLVTMRLTLAGERKLLFADTAVVKRSPGERLETAVRRAVLAAAKPMLGRLGDGARRRCFDPERMHALQKIAQNTRCAVPVAAPEPPPPAPAPAPAPPVVFEPAPAAAASAQAAEPPPPPPQAPAKPGKASKAAESAPSSQEAHAAKHLLGNDRFVVEDVVFAGRTSRLQRDHGLKGLAAALRSQPALKVRIEGFVDATSDRAADTKLSLAMARTAAERLSALGVARQRVGVAGRGAESPILPNFTARGRAANRRIEVVVVRSTGP